MPFGHFISVDIFAIESNNEQLNFTWQQYEMKAKKKPSIPTSRYLSWLIFALFFLHYSSKGSKKNNINHARIDELHTFLLNVIKQYCVSFIFLYLLQKFANIFVFDFKFGLVNEPTCLNRNEWTNKATECVCALLIYLCHFARNNSRIDKKWFASTASKNDIWQKQKKKKCACLMSFFQYNDE